MGEKASQRKSLNGGGAIKRGTSFDLDDKRNQHLPAIFSGEWPNKEPHCLTV